MASNVMHRGATSDLPEAVAGDGCFLIDRQGKRYLDASGGAAMEQRPIAARLPSERASYFLTAWRHLRREGRTDQKRQHARPPPRRPKALPARRADCNPRAGAQRAARPWAHAENQAIRRKSASRPRRL